MEMKLQGAQQRLQQQGYGYLQGFGGGKYGNQATERSTEGR